ncbi:MAG TPA: hypothetical protein VLT88_12815 [Desulfosarcina sp.]|nr:hypothetical protein [Desulfosarcina sp.]
MIQEAHCMGFAFGRRRTVDQWVNDQALSIHNRMNDMMLDLIGAKNRFRPGPLKPDEQKQVFTALYDLDAFRRIVPAGSGQQENAPSERSPARTHAEMVELLIDAMNFVCRHVFSVRA